MSERSYDRGPAELRPVEIEPDAVDYLRALSGRNDPPALEVDGDQAAAAAVATARVVF